MNKTKRVDAGIKSPADLAMRLEAGEVFWDGDNKVYYDSSMPNPFRYGRYELRDAWPRFAEFEKEIESPWHENIPKQGVLCSVYHDDFKLVRVIVSYWQGYFYDLNGGEWKISTPLNREECLAMCYEEQNK